MAKQNLTLYRGISYAMSYTHTGSMAGGTLYFTIKPTQSDSTANDSTASVQKTITSFTNGTVNGATVANAMASWTLTDADMYIPTGNYYYDIIFEDSSHQSLPPIFEGKVKVLPHPTNRNVSNG